MWISEAIQISDKQTVNISAIESSQMCIKAAEVRHFIISSTLIKMYRSMNQSLCYAVARVMCKGEVNPYQKKV